MDLRNRDHFQFWRVERVEAPRIILLHAEMKLQGEAWLQFELRPSVSGPTLFRCCAWNLLAARIERERNQGTRFRHSIPNRRIS